MEDEWNGGDRYQQYKTPLVLEEGGRSYGKGRGFIDRNTNFDRHNINGEAGYNSARNTDQFENRHSKNDRQDEPNENDEFGYNNVYELESDEKSNQKYGNFDNADGNDREFDFRSNQRYGRKNEDDRSFEEGKNYGGNGRNFKDKFTKEGGRGGDRTNGRNNKARDSKHKDDTNNKTKPKSEAYIPPELGDEESLFESGVQQGINFDKYDEIEVVVSGDNPPQPIELFEEAGLKRHILSNVLKSKYSKPTPVQKYALPIILSGRDLMACAQTGSGKTAAFVLPIIHHLLDRPRESVTTSTHSEPQVVIVSPTRELTVQIYEQVLKFSAGTILKSVVAYGGTSVSHQANRLSAGCDILVATPGRLIDFLRKGRLVLSSIRFLVLDEADRMLDMGFLPDIENLVNHETMVSSTDRQTLMFSATFPDDIQRLALRFLSNYLFLAVGIVGGACTDVEQNFYEVTKYKKRAMLRDLVEKEMNTLSLQGTLVFVEMKRTADFIAAFLSENNYPTTSIHGDRMQREREEALRDFKLGKMSILVATAVAARGLDIKNVAHVINYDMPKNIDEYVHRIGRTGRVGNRGRATSFFDPESDGPLTPDLIKILKQANQPIPDWLLNGGNTRCMAPGRIRKFGAADIRNFNEDNNGGIPYEEGAYTPSVPTEPEELW